MGDISISNAHHAVAAQRKSCWYEEEIEENLRWCFALKRAELERREEVYDVIIGDLADPIEGGPCYQLYTKSFYEFVVKPSLTQGGIFVTQAGPAGIFSHTEVFSCIYNTLRQVFKYVVPYSAHIPSYADTWDGSWYHHSPFTLTADELDLRIKHRIQGENRYLDGKTFTSSSTLSKAVRKSLDNETHVYTEGNARFIYGHGSAYKQQQHYKSTGNVALIQEK
ncbi:Thermospermine synthase ACAULIS5 [Sesamum angolense]|uniref:Thermospermine synthase ACAULIS5 n=1 Tax=Sesamum angolense TaxID=2727404 RepID=A0AAE1VZA4_9LAMI|nr:Thermospermine synthase ACAULIS5 [Sesamum angolense]